MNTARIIHLRPPPPDQEESYRSACAAFLRACFERFPRDEIKRQAVEMGRADIIKFDARKGRR